MTDWISPIRKFKSNDPYFYEVDNIPIRQIENNLEYLKNQVAITEAGINRIGQITDLRVDSLGGRLLRVNPGRFTARINDAYNKQGLISFAVTSGINVLTGITYTDTTPTNAYLNLLNNIIEDSAGLGKATNFNGLELLNAFYIAESEITPFGLATKQYGNITNPGYNAVGISPVFADVYPIQYPLQFGFTKTLAYKSLIGIHAAFVQKWKSPIRTAVVDIPLPLTIEVPEFSDSDFYYTSGIPAGGSLGPITPGEDYATAPDVSLADKAASRIDLVFLYAHPIDASSTTVADFEGVTPKTILRAEVGIIRGAGVGLFKSGNQTTLAATQRTGSLSMLPNLNDQNSDANTGITTITGNTVHGSFPSPDDLLNLAPNLMANLESTNLQLVGQTVLPLAYILVNKGDPTITQEDVMDIRPFLRTTELTYNERAGIAAASPKLSFANPAIGVLQLKDTAKKLNDRIDQAITSLPVESKPLYSDLIMGGLAYGVEGTLLSMNDSPEVWSTLADIVGLPAITNYQSFNAQSAANKALAFSLLFSAYQSELKSSWIKAGDGVGAYQNIPSNRNIPIWPEWDANAAQEVFYTQSTQGGVSKPSWWMYFGWVGDAKTNSSFGTNLKYAPLAPTYNFNSLKTYRATGPYVACTKTLQIILPSWVNDYDVLTEYVLCSPKNGEYSSPVGLRVNKYGISFNSFGQKVAKFSITSYSNNIGYVDTDDSALLQGALETEFAERFVNVESATGGPGGLLSYMVSLAEDLDTNVPTNSPIPRAFEKVGMAYYPTVKFTIIGYSSNSFKGPANGTLINDDTTLNNFSSPIPPIYDPPTINISGVTGPGTVPGVPE